MAKSRVRTMGKQDPSHLTWEYHAYGPPPYNPPSPVTGDEVVGCYAGTFKRTADYIQTGFKRTREPSAWVANPLQIETLNATASSGSATTTNTPDANGRGLQRTWSGDGVGYIFGALVPYAQSTNFGSWADQVDTARLQNLAVIDCLSRINPASLQGLVAAAEGRKTADMILDRARKLAIVWRDCRSGNLRNLENMFPKKRTTGFPKRIIVWDQDGSPIIRKDGRPVRRWGHKPLPPVKSLDKAERLWLEFRYGWTPLIHDIVDGLKAIGAQELRDDLVPKPFYRVLGRKEGEGVGTVALSRAAFGGGNWTGSAEIKHKVSVKAYAKYQVESPSGVMNRLNDFGAFDVPRTAWELVPFSFVVDWFIPIGDWLGALTPKVGVKVIESGLTTVITKTVTRTLSGYTPTATGPGQWPNPPFPLGSRDSFVAGAKIRSIGLPPPLLPSVEIRLNLKRLVDAAALLRAAR